MTSTDYAIPATGGGDKLPLADLLGSLLRVEVIEALSDVVTNYGITHPIRCNIAVLDGSLKAQTFDDALVFPRVMISQLKPSVGKVVIGRLGQGEAKKGQSAPWVLQAPTEEDIATARKYDAYIAAQAAEAEKPF